VNETTHFTSEDAAPTVAKQKLDYMFATSGFTYAGNPGTVAVLGTNLTAPAAAGSKAITTGRNEVSVGLAAALRGNTQGVTNFGIVSAGIENNAVLRHVGGAGGPSALSRLDPDILEEPGIGTVVATEGRTDVLAGTTADDLEQAYTTLGAQLNAWGSRWSSWRSLLVRGTRRAPRRLIDNGWPPMTG
jgi:hypothetical protein